MTENIKGYTDGNEFRVANQYIDTQRLLETLGLVAEVENRTPTVGVNVVHMAQMRSIQALSSEIAGKPLNVTILGISTAEGPRDFQRLLKGLGAGKVSTTAIDISDGIFGAVERSGLDEVTCLLGDARETGLAEVSQDFILRDHIGNCCPPTIDREIDMEAARLLKPGGIAVVNITTSELLSKSEGRGFISFEDLHLLLNDELIARLGSQIYDLKELKDLFLGDIEQLRGKIIEIEPGGSFVVFGEDDQGHGEWFRTIDEHKKMWQDHGFEIVEIKTREGKDSHNPPLQCLRHNVVLRKKLVTFGFDSDTWGIDPRDSRIEKLIVETRKANLTNDESVMSISLRDLSQQALAGLTILESNAFEQPMGESLVKAWLNREDKIVFIGWGSNDEPAGFIILDNISPNLHYIELIGVISTEQGKGLGTKLHLKVLEWIKNNKGQHIVLSRTQNPHEIMALRTALHQQGKTFFPIDRKPNEIESDAIINLLNSGKLVNLATTQSRVDPESGIMEGAYTGWLPPSIGTSLPVEFDSFLRRNDINFDEFCIKGNAFIIGGTI